MKTSRLEGKTFRNTDFSKRTLVVAEHENCTFVHCNFSGADLSNSRFTECIFQSCDLSNAKSQETVFRNAMFQECKLQGMHFDQCRSFLLSMRFDDCNLDFCTFTRLDLRTSSFKGSSLREADLTEANLAKTVFDNCDLERATFLNTNLEGADFRTAYNFCIDPEKNRLKKARFSSVGVVGLLWKYEIEIE